MGYQIQFLSYFLKKPHTVWLKLEKLVLGAHFPHKRGSIGPIVFKNNRVHPWVDPHHPCEFHDQNCDLHRNFTLRIRIRNQGLPKRKTWPPPPPPSEVEGVRTVVISFRKIVKNLVGRPQYGHWSLLNSYGYWWVKVSPHYATLQNATQRNFVTWQMPKIV